jgi:hypothetical protein
MKRTISLQTITRRLPAGFKLPAGFDAFVRTAAAADLRSSPWFLVTWTDPVGFELKREAGRELLPFLRLGDGGAVAFWLGARPHVAIVHFDSEGGKRLVAASFADFVRRLARSRTGVEDLDDREEGKQAIVVPGIAAKPAVAVGPLKKAFARWCAANSALEPPTRSADGERVRQLLVAVTRKMLRDGRSRVYKVRDSWWTFDFVLKSTKERIDVTYLDYGAWYPVPASYGMGPIMADLVRLTKHPRQRRYEVTVICDGSVSVNDDRELLLEAPKAHAGK